MSQAADWLVPNDQPHILIDLTGFADLNDRSGISIASFDAYDEDTRVRNYTDNDGMLEGGIHLPAERGSAADRGMDWWGFNTPLIEIPKPSSTSTVAPGGGGGGSSAFGSPRIGGSIGLNVNLGLSGGGSRSGSGFIGIGNRGGGALGLGGLGGNLFGNPGVFGLGKKAGFQFGPPQMGSPGGGGGGSPGGGGAGAASGGTKSPDPRRFLPIRSMGYDQDKRIKEIVLAQKAVAFPFCEPDPSGMSKPPTGKLNAGPVGAGPASKGFGGPHNMNEFCAPWPGGNPVLMVRATEEEALDYLAFRPWQNVTIAHHNGDTDPEYSTRLIDINDNNQLDEEKTAGFHTGLKVEESWGEHCGVSLFWGVREKDEDDVGRGLFTTNGEFGRNKAKSAQFMGYAGESGGGPNSAGAPQGDKHLVGRNRSGQAINQGHLWLKAPWYFSKFHDAPPEFDQKEYNVIGSLGFDWPVFLRYDDIPKHEILGLKAAAGSTAKGLMRWVTPMPFIVPPKKPKYPPYPPREPKKPDDFMPPWGRPRGPDGPLFDPRWPLPTPEPGDGDPVPLVDPGPLLAEYDLVNQGVISSNPPTDDFGDPEDDIEFVFKTKFMSPRPVDLSFAEMVSFNCIEDSPPTEFIRDLKNVGRAIYHWNEQRPTSFAFRPVHRGLLDAGATDLRYTEQLTKNQYEAVLRAPTVLRADAWAHEKGHGFEYVNRPGFGRNAWGDSKGGLCFYPANEGIKEVSTGTRPESSVCFKNVSIDLACPVFEGFAGGSTKDGFRFTLNPGRDVLIIARQDSFGNSIENTSIDSDGDFQTVGDVETGRAFKDPTSLFFPPGTNNAVAGQTVLVFTSFGAGTVALPDPTLSANIGAYVTVKDYEGQASTNNVTISTAVGKIDGNSTGASMTITEDLRAVTFKADGSNWVIVSDTVDSGGGGGAVTQVTSGDSTIITVAPTTGAVVVTAANQLMDTLANFNHFWGFGAGNLGVATGFNNNAFGRNALAALTTGGGNAAFGNQTLEALATGNLNVYFGGDSSRFMTSGSQNVGLGSGVGFSLTTGSRNILIGDAVDVPGGATDDFLNIGELIFGDTSAGCRVRIGGFGLVTGDVSLRLAHTDKAFMPNVLTTVQRNAIATPEAGMIIQNSTTAQLETYNGVSWVAIGGAAANSLTRVLTAISVGAALNDFVGTNSTSALTVTLPTAVGVDINARIMVKDYTGQSFGGHKATVAAAGGEFIDGMASFTLDRWEGVLLHSDGTNWMIAGRA